MAQFEKREFPEINRTAYEITDDWGHIAQLSPEQATSLLLWLYKQGLQLQDDEEAPMLASVHALYRALDTLRGIETSEIYIPGPHEQWEQALRVAYRASSEIDERVGSWQDELEIHHEREGQAEDNL
jgi:hypothetical protein